MIDRLFAERLIDKISQFTEYNINIMGDDGIIIASRMKERVGTFHEVAFQLLKGEEDSRVVIRDFHGCGGWDVYGVRNGEGIRDKGYEGERFYSGRSI